MFPEGAFYRTKVAHSELQHEGRGTKACCRDDVLCNDVTPSPLEGTIERAPLPSVLESDGINSFDRLRTYVNLTAPCYRSTLNIYRYQFVLDECLPLYRHVEEEEHERETIYQALNCYTYVYIERARRLSVCQEMYRFQLHKTREVLSVENYLELEKFQSIERDSSAPIESS